MKVLIVGGGNVGLAAAKAALVGNDVHILEMDVSVAETVKNVLPVSIIKGDAKSASIAAASIIAKVTRDRLMDEYDQKYPEYGFASHKGYGTAQHIEALKKHGPCPIHRMSFEPIKSLFAEKQPF